MWPLEVGALQGKSRKEGGLLQGLGAPPEGQAAKA